MLGLPLEDSIVIGDADIVIPGRCAEFESLVAAPSGRSSPQYRFALFEHFGNAVEFDRDMLVALEVQDLKDLATSPTSAESISQKAVQLLCELSVNCVICGGSVDNCSRFVLQASGFLVVRIILLNSLYDSCMKAISFFFAD